MKDRRLELKIKIKSLADEARTIRTEERKLIRAGHGATAERERLYVHRVAVVREESRASLLAYACIRGRAYRLQEPKTREPLNPYFLKKVRGLVDRFGGNAEAVEDWAKMPAAV